MSLPEWESLDFLYMPSRDVAADVEHFSSALGAEVLFAIEAFGTRVAMISLSTPSHGAVAGPGQQNRFCGQHPECGVPAARPLVQEAGGQGPQGRQREAQPLAHGGEPSGALRPGGPDDHQGHAQPETCALDDPQRTDHDKLQLGGGSQDTQQRRGHEQPEPRRHVPQDRCTPGEDRRQQARREAGNAEPRQQSRRGFRGHAL